MTLFTSQKKAVFYFEKRYFYKRFTNFRFPDLASRRSHSKSFCSLHITFFFKNFHFVPKTKEWRTKFSFTKYSFTRKQMVDLFSVTSLKIIREKSERISFLEITETAWKERISISPASNILSHIISEPLTSYILLHLSPQFFLNKN